MVTLSALRLGWSVTVWNPLSRFETRTRFAGANVVLGGSPAKLKALVDSSDRALGLVMTHDPPQDKAALAMLLDSRA